MYFYVYAKLLIVYNMVMSMEWFETENLSAIGHVTLASAGLYLTVTSV